ncbi:DUF2269 family protein [Paenibacillus sp.]|uniref:DUF2269 family protein n=1 Tax=Paenibacillus sp. TaxID=58172 RepID=UPI002D51D65F|nr:DUF2269 family protein [Paenibacillus sp.]HZG85083.1 DUF2269 family protein [Paenibacillus sp.]
MDWVRWLLLFHVLTAIIGVGPTYFSHVLLRANQSVGELRHSLKYVHLLEMFPKIGGTLAVLSGLILVAVTGYSFSEPWIIISIGLYVVIQIIVIGFAAPLGKKLNEWIASTPEADANPVPAAESALLAKLNRFMSAASILGVLLFAMMFLRPML